MIRIPSIKILAPVLLAGAFFCSCENDLNEVTRVTYRSDSPDEIMDTVVTVLTDKGENLYTLKAARIEKYYGDNPTTYFPRGVVVEFYDSLAQLESVLKANRGIIYERENRIELHSAVEFVNQKEKNELYTESLIWEQTPDSSYFYSDSPVRVIDGENTYEGKRLISADETFSRYYIRNFRAEIFVEDTTQAQ